MFDYTALYENQTSVSVDFLGSYNLFRIALWPSVGKELAWAFHLCGFYVSAVLIVDVPFPFGV